MTKLFILGIDMVFAVLAIAIALLVEDRFHLEILIRNINRMGVWYLLIFRFGGFVVFKTYLIIIRYVGRQDIKNFAFATILSSGLFALLILGLPNLLNSSNVAAVLLMDFLLLCFFGMGFRVFLRMLYNRLRVHQSGRGRINTIIFGAGEMGATLERVLSQNLTHNYKVVAFFDDNPKVHGKRLNGIQIWNPKKSFTQVIDKYKVQVGILAINNLSEHRRISFINACLKKGMQVLKVPPTEQWLSGQLNVGQLARIKFEDLLSRDPIQLSIENISRYLQNKSILITGCAGSIGSEIVRQVMAFEPKLVIGLDNAESPIVDLERELKRDGQEGFLPIVGDVRHLHKLQQVFEKYRPEVVFHAAAYKHVPIMEAYPEEALLSNVLGTKQVADMAREFKAKKFVMVSTDKAVNPANIMGASKRIAEMYVQSLQFQNNSSTQFITTRFGNVLGSNGSVIPIFRKQIEKRIPVTVTHPDITRYFMTIPEACQLVLEAGCMGDGGEIFVFDMGKPVKIDDLAKKMIQLSGLKLGEDIQIAYTGLRPGEKLYEELLDEKENLRNTHHPKILRASVRRMAYEEANIRIGRLVELAQNGSTEEALRTAIREMVPEYKPSGAKVKITNVASSNTYKPSIESLNSDEKIKNQRNTISSPQPEKGMKKSLLKTIGKWVPSDVTARRFPVSVKGLICHKNKVLLLKTEDGFWDLPGGKLKAEEEPEICLLREVKEETGKTIEVGQVLDSFNIHLKKIVKVHVIVIVYKCSLISEDTLIEVSQEHFDGQWFEREELNQLKIRPEYKPLLENLCRQI